MYKNGSMYKHIKYEINVIPLLDILLVLIVIFMATIPIIMQNINVDLPNSKYSNEVKKNQDVVIIEVPKIGLYNLVHNNNRINNITEQQIILEVHNKLSLNPDIMFLVGGAKQISYNEIIKILNLLRQENVRSVGMMTNPIS